MGEKNQRTVKYLIFKTPLQESIQQELGEWLKAGGGNRLRADLFTWLINRYTQIKLEICGEEEANERGLHETAYRIVDNTVFLPINIALGSLLE